MTIDLDQLAAALALRLRSLPANGDARKGQPVKGVYKHGRSWRVNTTHKRKRLQRAGFPTREAAERWLRAKRRGEDPPEAGLTVAEAIAFYLKHHKVKTQNRQDQLAVHVIRHMGNLDAERVRQADVDDYVTTRAGEGAAAKTAWNELGMLRAALRYGWRNDRNEEPRFTLSKPKSARRRVAWQDEAQLLVATAELPMRRVVLAAYTRGLRRSEVISARWEWLHGDVLLIPDTKTGVPKEIPLSPTLLTMLREPPVHPEYLFCRNRKGRNGKGPGDVVRWYPSTLRRSWRQLCKAAEIEGLTFHDLRRSMASVGLSLGHAPAAVQAAGGWADQVALMRHYSHAMGEQARAVGEDLERVAMAKLPLRVVK